MIRIGERTVSDVRIGGSPVEAVYYGSAAAWVRDRFVAVGINNTARSFDGSEWTSGSPTVYANGVAFGNGKFVAVGAHTIYASTNGVEWTVAANLPSSITLNSVSFGCGKFVAVGSNGSIFVSEDGVSWTSKVSLVSNQLNGIGFGEGLFRAVGHEGNFLESRDGETWRDGALGSIDWNGVSIADGKVVMVGVNGAVAVDESASQVGGNTSWNCVAYGNGVFAGVGDGGKFFYSINSTWATGTKESAVSWQGIAYGNGKFVAVGLGGWMMTSENGWSWTSFQVGNSNRMAICHT